MGEPMHPPTLVKAAQEGNCDAAETHLRDGADVNATVALRKTALMYAARNSHLEIVKLLLKSGADINAQDALGRTPLFYAAYAGCCEIVDLLLQEHADPNVADNFGRTALMHAAVKGHTDVAKLLVEKGADPGHQDKSGKTASEWGRLRQGSEWIHVIDGPTYWEMGKRVAIFGNLVFLLFGTAMTFSLISPVWQSQDKSGGILRTTLPSAPPGSIRRTTLPPSPPLPAEWTFPT